jgi:hypothetical protein
MNELRLKLLAKYQPYQFANTKTPTPFSKKLKKKNNCFFSFSVQSWEPSWLSVDWQLSNYIKLLPILKIKH